MPSNDFRYKQSRLQQLRGFCHAAASGSISKAAERLYLSQPSVSMQIQALERELDATLFERRGPKIRLTPDGELLYEMALPLIDAIDALPDQFQARRGSVDQGRVDVAAGWSSILYMLPPYIEQFRKEHPRIELKVHNLTGHEALGHLRGGQIDFAVGPLLDVPDDIEFHPIVSYEPLLITSVDHPLTKVKKLSLQEIGKYPFILPPRNLSTWNTVDSVFRKQGLPYEVSMEVGGWEVIKKYVELGLGISVTMSVCITGTENLAVQDASQWFPNRTYGVVLRKGKILTPQSREFIDLLLPGFGTDGLQKSRGMCLRRGTLVYCRQAEEPPLAPPHAGGKNSRSLDAGSYARAEEPPLATPHAGGHISGDAAIHYDCIRIGEADFVAGERNAPVPPRMRGGQGGLLPLEQIRPKDLVLSLSGEWHPVKEVLAYRYTGELLGIRTSPEHITWTTPDHLILANRRVQQLSQYGAWRDIPARNFDRARALRKEASPPEITLWKHLRAGQLGVSFRKQHPLGIYVADFYSRECALVIEVDGDTHFESAHAESYDAIRNAWMESLGLRVLRFTASEVGRNTEMVVNEIAEACCEVVEPRLENAQWRYARDLKIGDEIFIGLAPTSQKILAIETEHVREEIYDLLLDGAHEFNTKAGIVRDASKGWSI